jgi:AraC-like DNA-binding protein
MNCDPDATPAELLRRCRQSRSVWRARQTCRLGDVVQQLVIRLLRDGYPEVRSVAKTLELSARTLQRHLSEEGLTYAGIVTRARCDVAQRMLEDPACKIIEVALDLGYSDQAHFARAFVRWTGLTPREFRRGRQIGCRGLGGCFRIADRKIFLEQTVLLSRNLSNFF